MQGATIGILESGVSYLRALADATGVVDATTAVNSALAQGEIIDGGGGTYLVSNLTASVAGTTIRNASFIDAASTVGGIITLDAIDCALENVTVTVSQSSNCDAIRLRQDGYRLSNVHTVGQRWNMRLAYSSYSSTMPVTGILARKSDSTTQYGGRMEDCTIDGGLTGVQAFNQDGGHFENIKTEYTVANGFTIGGGSSSRRCSFINIDGYLCGQYALTGSAQTVPYITTPIVTSGLGPFPYEDIRVINPKGESCGWMTYLTGTNGTVGSGKLAFDFADGGNRGLEVHGARSINCAGGGAEYKGAISTTLYPSGRKGLKFELHVDFSFSSVGCYFLTDENSVAASSFFSDATIRGSTTCQAPTAWLAGMHTRPGAIRGSNSYTWLSAGNASGEPDYNGATAPTGGHAKVLITSTTTESAGQTTFTFADTTGISDGDRIFVAGGLLADGTTVSSHTGTTVTVSGAGATGTISSGAYFMFMKTHDDGTNLWFCLEATPAGAFGTGVEIRASTNISVDWDCFNTSTSWLVTCAHSADGSVNDLSLGGVCRGADYGLYVQGNGNSTITLRATDIDATTQITDTGSGTHVIRKPSVVVAPVTKTADFTVDAWNDRYINNKAGASCTVTLPAASKWPDRLLTFTNNQAQTVVSASSNVVPLGGGAAGTAMLAGTAGRWATMISDGTNWVITAGVV